MPSKPASIHHIGSANPQPVLDDLTVLLDLLDQALCLADDLKLPFAAISICEAITKVERNH